VNKEYLVGILKSENFKAVLFVLFMCLFAYALVSYGNYIDGVKIDNTLYEYEDHIIVDIKFVDEDTDNLKITMGNDYIVTLDNGEIVYTGLDMLHVGGTYNMKMKVYNMENGIKYKYIKGCYEL